MKYSKNTVRKNITVSKELSDNIEQLNFSMGISQSAIIEMAFRQPAMKRLTSFFGHEDDSDSVIDLLDCYWEQLDRYKGSQEISKDILMAIKNIYIPELEFRAGLDDKTIADYSTYCVNHMPDKCRQYSSVMFEFYNRAKRGGFEYDIAGFRADMTAYIDAMLLYDWFLTESCLFRNLAYAFDKITALPKAIKDDVLKKVFKYLAGNIDVFGVSADSVVW